MLFTPLPEGDMQAVGQEGNEDMCLDPGFVLVMDWADRQVTLEISERLFDFCELDVVLP